MCDAVAAAAEGGQPHPPSLSASPTVPCPARPGRCPAAACVSPLKTLPCGAMLGLRRRRNLFFVVVAVVILRRRRHDHARSPPDGEEMHGGGSGSSRQRGRSSPSVASGVERAEPSFPSRSVACCAARRGAGAAGRRFRRENTALFGGARAGPSLWRGRGTQNNGDRTCAAHWSPPEEWTTK
jgi:hypothetical protein